MMQSDRLKKMLINASMRAKHSVFDMPYSYISEVAEYLLAHGIVVLPCNIGDTIYWVNDGKIYSGTVYHIQYSDYPPYGIITTVSANINRYASFGVRFEDFGETAFFSQEEAKQALEEKSNERSAL